MKKVNKEGEAKDPSFLTYARLVDVVVTYRVVPWDHDLPQVVNHWRFGRVWLDYTARMLMMRYLVITTCYQDLGSTVAFPACIVSDAVWLSGTCESCWLVILRVARPTTCWRLYGMALIPCVVEVAVVAVSYAAMAAADCCHHHAPCCCNLVAAR